MGRPSYPEPRDSELDEYKELIMGNQEGDKYVDASFEGLRGTPTKDGGMLIEIGRDPAGEAVVDITPMFMPKIGNLATAIESRYMGVYGEPKVVKPSVVAIQSVKEEMRLGMHQLYNHHDNWPIMLVIRLMEEITTTRTFPRPHDCVNAANSLADAANKLVDALEGFSRG